jgi:GT2 family glycosyltransferase
MTTATVVICAFTEQRWDDLCEAVGSVHGQTLPPDQVVVVIDHNPALLDRARGAFVDSEVVGNEERQGLAGARNTGIRHAKGEIVAFLDDDARADASWLEHLVCPYASAHVHGTGGVARPNWSTGRPDWFPDEFLWVVGCSYRGLPETVAPIRNPIGAGMSFRRSVCDEVGGFDTEMGRVAWVPLGCEETVLGIRVVQHHGEGSIVQMPSAVVDHRVGPERATVTYFVRRCFAEGISKAAVAARVGATDGSSVERRYVSRVLPGGVLVGLRRSVRGEIAGLARAGLIVLGLGVTTVGYGVGRLGLSGVLTRLLVRDAHASDTGHARGPG